ncbi:Tripartite-type tricarboxylate transporter, receptor component TctC [Cohaesibacter sp. ES.047]|uniref:Bug family tripartite tricarboxylate transporter substrate binding protein n=1 Tax=Cohaesibacter sp. ES.047 TaxID=1798205 RepID=UPI000BB8C957|nr:tripartite tricarboxylate transporter substrate binding protein [Cohaesibacter sp. ES.047]SNY92373.1 Tripartite-type tricarboxylate transporter, receptor component TctC [Cohaesibacter sp. ES.047]
MKPISFIRTAVIAGATAAALCSPASAEYPDRNIQNIFPWGPGSAMAVSQIISEAISTELGVNINVVSTPGAAGVKSFDTAMKKPADGYTLIDGWVAPLVLQPMVGNADWTHKDFIPLWSATAVPFAIVTRKDETRWTDFPSFIQYMKENPGKLRYSSGSIGNIPHMVLAKMMQANDVYARNIPYPQDGDAFKDLRGGLLDFTFNNPTTYRSNSDAFQVLAVLTENEKDREMFDNAPLVGEFGTELGLSGLSPTGWHWYLVKQGTPDDVVAKLRDAMKAALSREDIQKKLRDTGFVPTMYPPEKYDEIVGAVGEQLKSAKEAIAWEQKKISGK